MKLYINKELALAIVTECPNYLNKELKLIYSTNRNSFKGVVIVNMNAKYKECAVSKCLCCCVLCEI
jgi:predicted metal-dependent RNase